MELATSPLVSLSSQSDPNQEFKLLFLDSRFSSIDLSVGVRSIRGGKNIPRFSKVVEKSAGDRFRVERIRYAKAENSFRRALQSDFTKLESFDLSLKEFYSRFNKRLYKHQVKMYLLGRRAAGRVDTKLSESERKMLHGQHSRQMKFFKGFVKDWAGDSGKMNKAHRLDMYGTSGYAVYLRGAVAGLPKGHTMRWEWVVNEEAEHCDDCVDRARKSKLQNGFSIEELEAMGYPGEGKTKCLTRCRCHVKPTSVKLRLPRTRPTSFKDIHHAKRIKAESGSKKTSEGNIKDVGSRKAQRVRGKRTRARSRS
jgi:hypothetical protein